MPQGRVPAIGEDVTALMSAPAPPPIGADVTALMTTPPATPPAIGADVTALMTAAPMISPAGADRSTVRQPLMPSVSSPPLLGSPGERSIMIPAPPPLPTGRFGPASPSLDIGPTMDAAPPIVPISPPGEIDRQKAWSLSPKRDKAAARMHQPAINTPDSLETEFGRAARDGTDPAAEAWRGITPGSGAPLPPIEDLERVPIVGTVVAGARQAARAVPVLARSAVRGITQPGPRDAFGAPTDPATMNAGSDVLEGGFKVLTPLLIGAGIAHPAEALIALVGSIGAAKATEQLSQAAGLSPEQTRILSDVAAGVVGAAAVPAVSEVGRVGGEWGRARTAATAERATWPIDVKTGQRVAPAAGDVIDTTAVRPIKGALEARPPVAELQPAPVRRALPPAPVQDVPAVGEDVTALMTAAPPVADVATVPAIGDDVTALVNAPAAAAPEPATLNPEPATLPTEPHDVPEQTSNVGTSDGAAPAGQAPLGGSEPGADDTRLPESAVPALDHETALLTRLTQEAVAGGHGGDPEELYKHLQERAAAMREIKADVAAAGGTPQELLRAIVKGGGIGDDRGNPGEIAWLRESSQRTRVFGRKLNKTSARPIKDHDRFTGELGGVPGVLHPEGSGRGLTFDGVVEYLGQDPRFAHIDSINALLEELSGVASGEHQGPGALTPQELGAHGDKWWEKILPPVEAPPAQLEKGESPADEGRTVQKPSDVLRDALPRLGFTLSTDHEEIWGRLFARTQKVLKRVPNRGEMRAVVNDWIEWAAKKETGSFEQSMARIRAALKEKPKLEREPPKGQFVHGGQAPAIEPPGPIETLAGRRIHPPAQPGKNTDRGVTTNVRAVDAWLLKHARLEAEAKRDEYNADRFAQIDPKKLTDADRAELNLYLFGQEEIRLDAPFSPQGLERHVVDTLDTGEQQPRLPAAGDVREQEINTPEFEAPFSLTGEAHDAGSVQEGFTFDRPEKPARTDIGLDEQSHREWRANADAVAANPEAATAKDLRRAAHYLSHKRASLIRQNPSGSGPAVESIDREIEYYDRLASEKSGRPLEGGYRKKGAGGGDAMRIDEAPQTSARGVARASVVPGLEEFVEQDVVPAATQAAADVAAAADDIRTLFAPASVSTAARDFSHVVRANQAARDQRIERAHRITKTMAKTFDRALRGATTPKAKAEILLKFADRVEGGRIADLPPDQAAAATLFQQLYAERIRTLQRLGKLQHTIPNYFAHVWADPKAATQWLRKVMGKRPLEGSKAFLKQRTIPTTREGIKAGLIPASYNPVELTLMKLAEMDKLIAVLHILKDGRRQGLTKYVAIGKEAPEGWRRFDQSFATVYGPPVVNIKEAYDRVLREKLEAFAASLGIRHTRKTSLGGGTWGLAYDKPEWKIETRFAGPETVLEHEIGHMIDYKYGLFGIVTEPPPRESHTFTKGKRKGQTVERAVKQDPASVKLRQKVNEELRKLADLRDEGIDPKDIPASRRSYTHKAAEKMANLVHAFIYNPELAKDVAPHAYWKLYNLAKDTPELRPLLELQKSRSLTLASGTAEKPIGGALIKGYYYGPPEVVQLLHNHLAPGLRTSVGFNIYRRAGNFMNQVQLGLSAFHMTMTGLESVISKQSLAFELLSRGQVMDALKKQLEVPVAPLVDLARGHKLLKQFYAQDANAQAFESIFDGLVQGGGGFGWSLFEHESAPAKFMQALRQGNYIGAGLRSIPALVELQAKPIMEGWVPRLKIAAAMDLLRMELPTLGEKASLAEARRLSADVWDSIDNRFGQLRYDNLFWHTALKDLGMASTRALGWNIGSIREALGAPAAQLRQVGVLAGAGAGGRGGGGKRPVRMVDVGLDADGNRRYEPRKEPWLHRKTAWMMATVFLYGLVGAVYQYLHTGKRPAELKDYFFPHNGDGDTRVSIPGYIKDWYAAGHALPGSLVETAKHKVNPLLELLADVYSNEDYFGTAIRNPDDPYLAQLRDLTSYVADTFQPISVKNFRERRADETLTGKSGGVNALESLFGVNRAPASVTRTAAEQLVRKYNPPQGRTKEQADQAQLRRQIRSGLQSGTAEGRTQATAAARSGALTDRQVQNAMRQSKLTYLQNSMKSLTLERALHVYEAATPEERRQLRPILQTKGTNAQVPRQQRAALLQRWRAALALPVAKPDVESAFR